MKMQKLKPSNPPAFSTVILTISAERTQFNGPGCNSSNQRAKSTQHICGGADGIQTALTFICNSLFCLSGSSRHDHPRHFWIEPANAVAANDKICRIKHVALDEIQHRAIKLRPFRLN
jgi:hypothetical protein